MMQRWVLFAGVPHAVTEVVDGDYLTFCGGRLRGITHTANLAEFVFPDGTCVRCKEQIAERGVIEEPLADIAARGYVAFDPTQSE